MFELLSQAIRASTHRPDLPRRAQEIHANSLATYRADIDKLGGRAAEVFDWISKHGAHTDREVMNGMGFTDMNSVRPRITELVDAKLLIEVDKVRDELTRKHVRVVCCIGEEVNYDAGPEVLA